MLNVAEALTLGTRHHQAGQLADAERIYRQVLSIEPDNPQALHLLGLLAMQARQFEVAIELIGHAIRGDRRQAAFHANLGEAQRHAGRLDEAIAAYRTALAIQPGVTQIHVMLAGAQLSAGRTDEAIANLREALRLSPEDNQARARLGHALHEQGQLSEAEACFRRVLRADPGSAEAHFNLAGVLQSQGKHDDAVASYRAALAIDPQLADAHNNLGTILKDRGMAAEAIEQFQSALSIQSNHAPALTNLGLVFDSQDRYDAAAQCYRAAATADPSSALAHYSLGAMLARQGQLSNALDCYQQALQIDANYVAAHLGVSHVLQLQGKWEAAIACCERAIQIDPNSAEAYSNLGAALSEHGRRDEAILCFERAIQNKPNFALAHGNLAVALQALGRLDEAIDEHRRAVELAPDNSGLHSNLLYLLNYHPAYDPQTLFRQHRAWGERHADPLLAQSAPHRPDRSPVRRLRVGYVSPHFMAHAVNFFVEPILAMHDHEQFEVTCYSDLAIEDETTRRLRGYADRWRTTVHDPNEQLAELVRQDQIDILVDLTGHISGGKRMLMFARKPAPIQVTYIGYQNTTGMRAMDYRLTDDWSDPAGTTDSLHTERLVRLPTAFFCYLPSSDAPPPTSLPAASAQHVTFGSFNNFAKVTSDVLAAWAAILARVSRSRLIILGDMAASLRERIVQTFSDRGIGSERIELVHRVPRNRYLELINRVDIALDPFPFNGHTTTCDCLWQGVPVVTLAGQTYASRFGSSSHRVLGLEELIAKTSNEYVEIAASLAYDLPRLMALRDGLRGRMAASALVDYPAFTRRLEAAYRRMWQEWLERPETQVTPESIEPVK
jgi:protein O-GlcNAc transferase